VEDSEQKKWVSEVKKGGREHPAIMGRSDGIQTIKEAAQKTSRKRCRNSKNRACSRSTSGGGVHGGATEKQLMGKRARDLGGGKKEKGKPRKKLTRKMVKCLATPHGAIMATRLVN